MKRLLLATVLTAVAGAATAAPVTYEFDPTHTYPSFEADHMGLSLWRGKFNSSKGQVVMDRAARNGTVEVEIDIDSVDFGHDEMNAHAKREDIFDVANYPTATYRGQLVDFRDGLPTAVDGELTLRGVTQPLRLTVNRMACKPHPMFKREVCGVDAEARFDRSTFGIEAGKQYGFDMGVLLRIQAEGIATE